jgi:Uma2 family endonuclease
MSTALSPPEKKLMTAEEFLALPDDGTERWLVNGEIRPRERTMTFRNRTHSAVEANIAFWLKGWLRGRPEPRGIIHSGEAGFRLPGDLDSVVGIDVAYASAGLVATTEPESPYYNGPPVLAVEILSPSDKHEDITKKIRLYLAAGVVVWEVDPDFRRVSVHRPGQLAETFNASQELSADPYLPGFRVAVAAIFDD